MDLQINRDQSFVWIIAYIDRDFLDIVTTQLSKHKKYSQITAFIPTVKVLKKTIKKVNEYEYVPLLFNYGFFKIPTKLISQEFLTQLKEDVQAIHAWVKDPATVYDTEPHLNLENKTIKRNKNLIVGVASDLEISKLITSKHSLSVFDKDELDRIKPGDTIVLKGYPFEGLHAKVQYINSKAETVRVQIDFENVLKEVILSFDNVFWSIYQGDYDESFKSKEESLEEIKIKNRIRKQNNHATREN